MFSRKLVFGLLYGLAAGLAFSIAAWGVNAYLLSKANWSYPWISFLPGLAVALLLGGFAGWITMRSASAMIGAITWLFSGLILGYLTVWLPWSFTPKLVLQLEPVLQGWVKPYDFASAQTMLLFCVAVTAIPALLIGALENALVEQSSYSRGDGAILLPMLLSMFLLALPGLVADNLVNASFRSGVRNLDLGLTFAVDYRGQEVDKALARANYLGALKPIQEQLQPGYRLYYFKADEIFEQVQLLVSFDNQWALCTLVVERPAYCQMIAAP